MEYWHCRIYIWVLYYFCNFIGFENQIWLHLVSFWNQWYRSTIIIYVILSMQPMKLVIYYTNGSFTVYSLLPRMWLVFYSILFPVNLLRTITPQHRHPATDWGPVVSHYAAQVSQPPQCDPSWFQDVVECFGGGPWWVAECHWYSRCFLA